jgi:hypothetical protein
MKSAVTRPCALAAATAILPGIVLVAALAMPAAALAGSETPPARMELHIGGFSGPNYEVSLIEGTGAVRYRSNPRTFIRPGSPGTSERVLKIPARRGKVFRGRLDRAGIWAWRKEYSDSAVLDGTRWSADITWNGRTISSDGSNDFPAGFQVYRAAVRELLGGEAFE